MKRVCFFSGDINRGGGTERVSTVIANGLAERGFLVSILSVANGLAPFFEVNSSVKLFSLNMESYSANLSDWRIWSRLRKFVLQESIEILIDIDPVLTWYSVPATGWMPTKVISWEHFHLGINVGDWGQRVRRIMGRWLAARCAKSLVVLTERDRQKYLSKFSKKTPIVTILNPKTVDNVRPSSLESRTILTVGRLVPQKGFHKLLEIWAHVKDHAPGWQLRIVGSGGELSSLEALACDLEIESTVEFVPHSQDVRRHYLASSIFTCTSEFEGFGLVLLEAKSFGLPIVSFDCDCGPAEIVRDGVDGRLVPPGDISAFVAALRELIENEAGRLEMGRKAYSDNRFELNAILDQWEAMLDSPRACHRAGSIDALSAPGAP